MKHVRYAALAMALLACGFFLSGCPKSMKTMQNQDSSPTVQEYVG